MEFVVANLRTGKVRRVTENGRVWLVARATLINPGVLNGSRGPGLYLPDEIGKDFANWHGQPLTHRHPKDPQTHQPVTASTAGVLANQGIGEFRNPAHKAKLAGEAWFDEELTRNADRRFKTDVHARLIRGEPIELSTGLLLEEEPAPEGSVYNGTPYKWVARKLRPDHVAVLPDEVGACSIKDGCGIHNSAAPTITENRFRKFWDWFTRNAKKKPSAALDMTASKACAILRDGSVHGKPLTESQRGMFGAKCGKRKKKATTNALVTNTDSSPTTNAEQTMKKDEAVQWLVGNCSCWKGGAETLNKLDDKQLAALVADEQKHREDAAVANAAKAGFAELGLTLTANMSAAEMAKMCKEYHEKKKPAENAAVPVAQPVVKNEGPLTERLKPDELRVWNTAVRLEQQARQAVTEQLNHIVANTTNPRKAQVIKAKLAENPPVDVLEELLAVSMDAPAANAAHAATSFPSFLGVGGGPHPVANEKDDSDNLLPTFTTDWGEFASPKLHKQA